MIVAVFYSRARTRARARNRNRNRNRTILLATLLFAGFLSLARADFLDLVPREDEVVMGINVRQIADSDVFQRFLELQPHTRDQLGVFQRGVGIDLRSDVDQAFIFGKIGQPDSMGIVFRGRIDQAKVLKALAAYPDNTTRTVQGLAVHGWRDPREGQNKFCLFLPDGTMMIWNSEKTMEASLAAVKDSNASLLGTPDGDLIPAEDAKAVFWIVTYDRTPAQAVGAQNTPTPTPTPMPTPAATAPKGRKSRMRRRVRNFNYDTMVATVTMNQRDLQARMTLSLASPEDAQTWAASIQAAILYGQFQTQNSLFRELATRTRINMQPDGRTAVLTTGLNLDSALDMMTGRRNLEDPDN